MKTILLMHGPNLNWLGKRSETHYGQLTLNEIEQLTALQAKQLNYELITFQSNHEGALIDALQLNSLSVAGIIVNPGALTHYSYALYDALLDTNLPLIEVHLSDLAQRESWRQHSVTAPAAIQVISGKFEKGYIEAVQRLVEYLQHDQH